jgi:rhodanese-related sulfurtransferase
MNLTCDELIAKGFNAPADADIVVYCHSGFRSANAQRILQSKGFKRVRNLKGGVVAWKGPIQR